MGEQANTHGTALVVGDRGILVEGASGSGKTTLALTLLAAAAGAGRFCALVADDQVFLEAAGGRLLATAPPTIAGLVELWGAGPKPIRHQERAVIDLVVRLVEAEQAPRYAEAERTELQGCSVPVLILAQRNTSGALPAILERMNLPPFDRHAA